MMKQEKNSLRDCQSMQVLEAKHRNRKYRCRQPTVARISRDICSSSPTSEVHYSRSKATRIVQRKIERLLRWRPDGTSYEMTTHEQTWGKNVDA